MTKPKHLTLRPAEVARFLRPSGLVVLPIPAISNDDQGRTFKYLHGKVWASMKPEELAPLNENPSRSVFGAEALFSDDGLTYTPIVVGQGRKSMGNALTCPLGGPGTEWVGREEFIPCQSIGFPCKPSEASYVCFRDGEQQYRDGKHSKWTLKDPPNWKAERHVFLPARRMPLWAARIRKTTTRVELRRVRTISDDEIKATGITPDRATDHPRGVWYTAFMADFDARYPGSWDRDDYCWFVFYTDTLGTD